jgi:hypothetical protein
LPLNVAGRIAFAGALDAFFPKYNPSAVAAACLNYLYLGLALLVFSYCGFAFFGISAARQVRRIRSKALEATLRQELVCLQHAGLLVPCVPIARMRSCSSWWSAVHHSMAED